MVWALSTHLVAISEQKICTFRDAHIVPTTLKAVLQRAEQLQTLDLRFLVGAILVAHAVDGYRAFQTQAFLRVGGKLHTPFVRIDELDFRWAFRAGVVGKRNASSIIFHL